MKKGAEVANLSGRMDNTILASGKMELGMERECGPISVETATMETGSKEKEKAMEFISLEDNNTEAISLILRSMDGEKKNSSMVIFMKEYFAKGSPKEKGNILGLMEPDTRVSFSLE
jgi:hypothetical protein